MKKESTELPAYFKLDSTFIAGLAATSVFSIAMGYISYPFLVIPIGSSGRPMGFSLMWIAIGGIAFLFDTVCAMKSWKPGTRGNSVVLSLFAFLPLLIGFLALKYALEYRDYQLLP